MRNYFSFGPTSQTQRASNTTTTITTMKTYIQQKSMQRKSQLGRGRWTSGSVFILRTPQALPNAPWLCGRAGHLCAVWILFVDSVYIYSNRHIRSKAVRGVKFGFWVSDWSRWAVAFIEFSSKRCLIFVEFLSDTRTKTWRLLAIMASRLSQKSSTTFYFNVCWCICIVHFRTKVRKVTQISVLHQKSYHSKLKGFFPFRNTIT